MTAQQTLAIVAAGTSLAWITFEALWPSRDQVLWRRGSRTDLLHAVLSNAVVNAVLQVGVVALLLHAGFTTAWLDGRLPLVVEAVALIVVSEVLQYWIHRWMHSSRTLWRFHRLHHSAESMDWLTGFSKHPVESGIRHLAVIVPALAIGFSPEAWIALGVANLLFAGGTHINAFVVPSWLDRILVTPHFHSIHHSRRPEDHDTNYAGKLSFIDWIFGSAKHSAAPRTQLGLDTPEPDGYVAQLRAPFRRYSYGTPTLRCNPRTSANSSSSSGLVQSLPSARTTSR